MEIKKSGRDRLQIPGCREKRPGFFQADWNKLFAGKTMHGHKVVKGSKGAWDRHIMPMHHLGHLGSGLFQPGLQEAWSVPYCLLSDKPRADGRCGPP